MTASLAADPASSGVAGRRALPRLLYIEDETDIAQITVEVLGRDYDVVHAPTGERGLELALRQRFDVMVVDRRLPGLSGGELVRAVRTAALTTPVLMLTALGSVEDRVSGLDGGADDYLVKPFDFAELGARLRALRRARRTEGARREVGDWLFVPASQVLYAPTGERVALTATETQLLDLLSSSPEHVFAREEILDAVFPGGSPATVDAYVHYLRRKASPELVDTVRNRGYRCGQPT